MDDYRTVNLANWEDRAAAHANSPDYDVARFVEDPTHLSPVVEFDRPLLGDVAGLRGLHLQCHIGTDTLSLHRLGATMTGLDFSPAALEQARKLAAATGAAIAYVESEVYEAPTAIGEQRFDLVYTGVGALCWLPNVARWAEVVAALLAPGGRLFLRDAHPMLFAIDERRDDGLLAVEYPYFERAEPLVYVSKGTYVATDAVFEHNTAHLWNHGLGEIVTALLDNGFELHGLVEHESLPWEAFPGQMERREPKEFRLRDRPWRLAHSYTLQARHS